MGIEAIETHNESNDPYCGHLKMTWKRKTRRETMTSGPNDDKLGWIMVTLCVLTWNIKTGSMHMLLLLFDDEAKHVVWWHLKHGCLMAPWTTF